MKTTSLRLLQWLCGLCLVLVSATPALALNTMISYTAYPPIVSEAALPNVLILISNDQTGFYAGYPGMDNYDNTIDYWGYFDEHKYYNYSTSKRFVPVGLTGADHYTPAGTTTYWSGNFLNWLTMCHADFLRKALTGGKRSVDSVADGATVLQRGTVPADKHEWQKSYKGANFDRLVPGAYADTSFTFFNTGTKFDVLTAAGVSKTRNTGFSVEVAVCFNSMPERNCEPYPVGNQKPQGLLQQYHDQMRFALMSYSHAYPDRGGILRTQMGTVTNEIIANNGQEDSSSDSIIRYVNNYTEKGYDPLAEMLYDGIRFLRGNASAQTSFCAPPDKLNTNFMNDDGYPVFGCTTSNKWVDPVEAWCQKNNILIINDEYPSRDGEDVPGSAFTSYTDNPMFADTRNKPYNPDVKGIANRLGENEGIALGDPRIIADYAGNNGTTDCDTKPFPGLGNLRGICESEPTSFGTYYTAALAYDAFTEDMRPDLQNDQNVRTYALAFRASSGSYKIPPPPLNQLWLAGKYGNFDDLDGSGLPDSADEWMKNPAGCTNPDDYTDEDCHPKGFFYAEGGEKIEEAINEIFESILRRAASGTAVSVLATSGQGEGNLVQAYYRPAIRTITGDIKWTGYIQSLWVDAQGNLREDTNGNLSLEEDVDKIIEFFLDSDGTTKIKRFDVSADNEYPDTTTAGYATIPLNGIETLWEGGRELAARAAGDRSIFTYIDKNKDEAVNSGELVSFNLDNSEAIMPYLSVQLSAPEINEDMGRSELTRAQNLIQFIRGNDPKRDPAAFTGATDLKMRDRVIGGNVWKLGDIIQSTPVSVSSPSDRIDVIYSDETYQTYYDLYKNRETVVYVGANDGMLHAFTSWQYDPVLQQFTDPDSSSGLGIGSELWAYIPQNLLPHLRWLARRDYTHVNYMDLQTRIFDARIFAEDDAHPHGWGTVLVVGMNFGGGMTTVTGDFDDGSGTPTSETRSFKPSYICFDITQPRSPALLWERTYDGMGFSRSMPGVIRLGNKTDPGQWYLTFGSGPDAGDINGTPRYDGESDAPGRFYVVDLATGAAYGDGTNDWLFSTTEDNAFLNTPATYDRSLNFNDDAVYYGTTYDNDDNGLGGTPFDWKGSVYRLLTVTSETVDSTTLVRTVTYSLDPRDWTLEKLVDSPRPITAAGSLSVDRDDTLWAYFGTGRYFSKGAGSDEVSADQEYLFGVKDPRFCVRCDFDTSILWSTSQTPAYSVLNLFDADQYAVGLGGVVYDRATGAQAYATFDLMMSDVRNNYAGWYRSLLTPTSAAAQGIIIGASERSLNKPAVLYGLVFYTTFIPKGDICDYGGTSSLWALYYMTGTAYKLPTLSNGTYTLTFNEEKTIVNDRISLGPGSASPPGIFIPKDGDPKLFIQQGSGNVEQESPKPPEDESESAGLRSWMEQ